MAQRVNEPFRPSCTVSIASSGAGRIFSYHRPVRREEEQGESSSRGVRRRRWAWVWGVYLVLLAASHAWMAWRPAEPAEAAPAADSEKASFTCPQYDDEGEAAGPALRVAYSRWGDEGAKEVVILIHGSPGSGSDFSRMGPVFAERGYAAIAPDLPGFGASTRRPVSYSTRAHARAALAMMDHLGVSRAHVVGWSMGGGVALHMADIAPERVKSITMLAAIGDQSVEGSGSYCFEHAKYRLGWAALWGAYVGLPHFGAMGDVRDSMAHSSVRNFMDTDMRVLRPVMERLRIPTLIIAGRDDFLVPLRAPLLHHALIRPSRLVVMNAMHFMPFLQAEETTGLIAEFIEREAPRGEEMKRASRWIGGWRSPPFGMLGIRGAWMLERVEWWMLVPLIALLTGWRRFLGPAVVVALINALLIDWGVGLFGVFVGVAGAQAYHVCAGRRARRKADEEDRAISRVDWRRRLERAAPGFRLAWRSVFRPDISVAAPRAVGVLASGRRTALYGVGVLTAAVVWTLVVCLPLLLLAALIAMPLREKLGWAGTVVSVVVLWLWARNFVLIFSWTGRRMLMARAARVWRHEYWPAWVYYAPLVPYLMWLAVKHRHPLAFTACNPAIGGGGGVIGESKHETMTRLSAPEGALLKCVRIEEHRSAEERARAALEQIRTEEGLGGFPVILKPDAGLRGFGVKLARGAEDVERYCREMTRAFIVQRYHPGPGEVGVFWARDLLSANGEEGFVYSITRKEFPYVRGDGVHTLEELIYMHPRHRRQAATFLARFRDDASRVVAAGESVRLAQSGNHCQGTLFRDGADLITPRLERAINELALSCAAGTEDGRVRGGLDVGRFDLRFASEEDLREGRNFSVVELNGATGESTNIYDPEKSLVWSYRVLFGQWRLLYELGAWRRAQGARAWSVGTLARSLWAYYKGRTGSRIAD